MEDDEKHTRLFKDISTWKEVFNYTAFESFVRKIDAVNYRAERRVKFIQDNVVSSRNEKDLPKRFGTCRPWEVKGEQFQQGFTYFLQRNYFLLWYLKS